MRKLFKDKNLVRLCLATFLMSSTIQLIWLALPFIVKAMKGSDTAVGLCFMGQMGVYVFFCILSGLIIDKLNPHKLLLVSSAIQFFISLGLFATVLFGQSSKLCVSPVVILIVLMSLVGVNTAFYWPVMMGWVSTGYEGADLTKRLGFYNTSWGIVNVFVPVVAGYLLEINYIVPVAAAVVTSALCFISVISNKHAGVIDGRQNVPEQTDGDKTAYGKSAFVWVSRVAMFTIFVCIGLFRSQVGIFYKFELGFAESVYGWSVAIMCFVSVAMFYLMGKDHWWHYKKVPFAINAVIILLAMLTVLLSKNIVIQFTAAAFVGVCYGFAYSSHQYYGVSGGKKRSGLMAIHEIILGTGMSCGAFFGGLLSDAFGRYSPYRYACVLVFAAGIAQVILWFFLRRKTTAAIKT